MDRFDPLGPEFYGPLGVAEKLTDGTFYLAGVLSIVVLLLDKSANAMLYDAAQATFVLLVILFFLGGLIVRTYFAARAHNRRISDFISNAFSVPLLATPSTGYYNTPGNDPYVRMGAALLENALFSEAIVRRMLRFERSRVAIYLVLWLWAVLFRATDLGLVTVAAQVLFSEQLISRWARMEWLRARLERVYNDTYRLFSLSADYGAIEFQARTVEGVVVYETSKAQAGLSMSSRVFKSLDEGLSMKWKSLAIQLGIASPSKGP